MNKTNIPTTFQKPCYSLLNRSDAELREIRTKYIITHNPSYAQAGEEIYIKLNDLGATHVIDPNSINLRFVFTRTDKTAKMYNNLSANLVQRLIVSLGGETVYDNAYENLMSTYTDLWLCKEEREKLTEFGISNELLRNPTTDKTKETEDSKVTQKLVKIFKYQKISIGKIISNQGCIVPSANLSNLEFTLVLADANKVLSSGSYRLSSLEVEYDIISSPSFKSMVVNHYKSGKSFPFKGLSWLHQNIWQKGNMLINENINVSKQCLNQIIMLFTKIKRDGSEEFVFPGVSNINITSKGVPGAVYNSGIKTVDLLTEARKAFTGKMTALDFFCNNMFALCIDLRSTFAQNEYGNGRNTLGGANIVLEIQRDPELVPDFDLKCHVYVAYDSVLNVNTQGMVSLIS